VRIGIELPGACENGESRKAAKGERLNDNTMERKERVW